MNAFEVDVIFFLFYISVLLGLILQQLRNKPSPPAFNPVLSNPSQPPAAEEVEILQKHEDGQLYHHSWRSQGHPDIAIFAKNSRFNVRRQDGSLMREDS